MSEGCCFTGELHSSVYESGLAVDGEKELVNMFLVTLNDFASEYSY